MGRIRRLDRSRWWKIGRHRVERVVFGAARWAEPHVRGVYGAVGLVLIVGLALAVVAIWAFAELAGSVLEGETLWFDRQILLWLDQHASSTLDVVALEVTVLGSAVVVSTLVLVASAVFWFTRHRIFAFLLWAAVAGGLLLSLVLKLVFARPRPTVVEWRAHYASFSSFPSGHAMMSMIVYVTLAYLIVQLHPPRAVVHLTTVLAIGIIGLVGLSRLYLGVHYPSDILAGYAVGFAWATLCAFTAQFLMHMGRSRNDGRDGCGRQSPGTPC